VVLVVASGGDVTGAPLSPNSGPPSQETHSPSTSIDCPKVVHSVVLKKSGGIDAEAGSAVSELPQAPRMRVKDRTTNVDFKKGCISLLRMF